MYYILTSTTFTGVTTDNRTITISSSNAHWNSLLYAVRDKDWDLVEEIADMPKAINKYGLGQITVVDGVIYYQDTEVHNTVTERIVRMMGEGFDVDPMLRFLENLMDNPSNRSVRDLYRFLEHNSLPITSDGHFLAYKYVTDDFKDCYSRTKDNSVGSTVSMERRDVEDNPDVTCSSGLHFCSIDYLGGGGQNVVILKINPADVVSIPTDYNNAKGRCCRYKVVGVHAEKGREDTLSQSAVNTAYDEGYDAGFEDASFYW